MTEHSPDDYDDGQCICAKCTSSIPRNERNADLKAQADADDAAYEDYITTRFL